jgi:hypothetical protein
VAQRLASETRYLAAQRAAAAAAKPIDVVRASRLAFAALCLYFFTQAFTIPILTVGPSWAVWPGLPDVGMGVLVMAAILMPIGMPVSSPNVIMRNILFGVFGAYLLAFIAVNVWFRLLYINNVVASSPEIYGAFHIFRLMQFVLIFWATTRIPMTPGRLRVLNYVITIVLIFVCTMIILTYFSIIKTEFFGGHIPNNPNISGPWAATYLRNYDNQGMGTIGYNHGYVAAQVVMLMGLKVFLSRGRDAILNNLLLLLSIVACFTTTARAGFVSCLVLAVLLWARRPLHAVIGLILVVGAVVAFVPSEILSDRIISTLDRQITAFQPGDTENLSDRDNIWTSNIAFLNEDPARWVFGLGIGTNQARGVNAHLLPLHIIMETGLIGLFIYIFVTGVGFFLLWKYEAPPHAMLITAFAQLSSGFAQEIFYPVSAFSYFMGFFLVGMALALQEVYQEKPPESPPPAESSPAQLPQENPVSVL